MILDGRKMTKEEHIKHWEKQVEEDFDCAQVLHEAGHLCTGFVLGAFVPGKDVQGALD